jgi:hypothetical protein
MLAWHNELRYNNNMHNISVDDVFIVSNESMRVREVIDNVENPDDPILIIESIAEKYRWGKAFLLSDLTK